MLHELIVDNGVEEFGNDGEEGYGAKIYGQCCVSTFVQFDEFGVLECVRVLCFFDRLVEERGEDGGEEVAEVSDNGWGNVVNVGCLGLVFRM